MIEKTSIQSAYDKIKDHIRLTPVLHLNGADFGLEPFPIVLKLEHLQHGGSFKARGAFTNLLSREIPAAGVVAGLHTLLFAAAVVHFVLRAFTLHSGGPLPELRWWLQSAPIMVCLVAVLIVWAIIDRS